MEVVEVEVFLPSPLLADGMCFVDTRGLGSIFAGNTAATQAFIPQFDAAIIVVGADPPIAGEEMALVEATKPLFSYFSLSTRPLAPLHTSAVNYVGNERSVQKERPMPAALDQKEKAAIVNRLFVVFQDHGYEGASIADLSRATGLGKSSLYHHFPRGKEEMAEAVLEKGKAFMQSAVADVASSSESLKGRIRKIIAALDQLYANGRNPCVLGRLAVSEIGPTGRRLAKEIFAIWTDAVAHLAHEGGMSPIRARHFAEDWIARVQGSLILYAATGDCGPFERAMIPLLELAKEKPSQK